MKIIFAKYLLLLLHCLSSSLTHAELFQHKDLVGKIIKLSGEQEIYIGAGFSADRLPIYYAMEKLDANNNQQWFQIFNDRQDDRETFGFLYSAYESLRMLFESVSKNKPMNRIFIEQKYGNMDYFHSLKDIIEKNKDRLKKYFTSGNAGFHGLLSLMKNQRFKDNKYIVYASKSPITGPFKPKKRLNEESTLQEIEEAFEDLIMVMGVIDNKGFPTTTHRGIQKNPFYSLSGEFKDFSLQFHGFAAAIALAFFQNKKYILVSPVPSMAKILTQKIGPDDMFIGVEKNCTSQTYISQANVLGFFPICINEIGEELFIGAEEGYIIKLDALSKFYRG
jgi:hypothetical protein